MGLATPARGQALEDFPFYRLQPLSIPRIDNQRRDVFEVLDFARRNLRVGGEHDSGDRGVAQIAASSSSLSSAIRKISQTSASRLRLLRAARRSKASVNSCSTLRIRSCAIVYLSIFTVAGIEHNWDPCQSPLCGIGTPTGKPRGVFVIGTVAASTPARWQHRGVTPHPIYLVAGAQ